MPQMPGAPERATPPAPSTRPGFGPPPGDAKHPTRSRRIVAALVGAALLAVGITAWAMNRSPGPATTAPAANASSPSARPSKAPKALAFPPGLAPSWTAPAVTGDILRAKLMGTWRTGSSYYIGRGTGIASN